MNMTPWGRWSRAGLAGLCLLSLAGWSAGPAKAQAAGDGKSVTLNLQNAPVQTVLRSLFKSAGQNFTIDPNVTGTVNVNVNGVSFQQALDAILSGTNPPLQAPLQNGIYHVGVQQAQPAAPPANSPPAVNNTPTTTTDPHHAYRIPIAHYDAAYMAYLIAAFSRKGGSPIVVPSDPSSQSTSSNGGNGNGNGGGFGNSGFGNRNGFGNTGFGSSGFGNTGVGSTGFGNSGFGNTSIGGFGNTGFGGFGGL